MRESLQRKGKTGMFLVVVLAALSFASASVSAVPHPGHTQPPRGNGPADPGNGNGRGNPNGNNGTIKIDGVESDGTFDGHPNNEPHISCPFEVDLYGFDSEENGDVARLVFRHWPPTGGKQEIAARGFAVDQPGIDLPPVSMDGNHIIVPIDHDGAGGGVDIDREVRTFLDLPDVGAHPIHGFHVRLDAQITSGGREYKKTKVFWVTGCPEPKIDIEKFVNGYDADYPPGPTLPSGVDAIFDYVVTNKGEVPLAGIMVTDNVVGMINCPSVKLAPGESMTCDSTTMAVEDGRQAMKACVKGFHLGRKVHDCDPVFYQGKKLDPPKQY